MGRHGQMRTASIAALGVLVLLAGCDNRSGDAAKSETSRTTQAPNAVQPSRLELRPVIALFPPEGQEFEGDDVVLSARSDTGAPLRYAVGPVALTGRDFVSAKAEHVAIPDLWVVVLRPTPAGVAKMNRLAQAGYDRQPPQNSVAIVVDGVVQSAPQFNEPSFNGDIQISGNLTEAQAKTLANTVTSGAL